MRKINILTTLLFILSIVSCSNDMVEKTMDNLVGDPAVTVIEVYVESYPTDIVESALKLWQTQEEFEYVLVSSIDKCDLAIYPMSPEQLNVGKNTITLGLYTYGPTPYIRSITNAWVFTHEMGHALGYDHCDDSNSIMYPYAQEETVPTLQHFRNLQAFEK